MSVSICICMFLSLSVSVFETFYNRFRNITSVFSKSKRVIEYFQTFAEGVLFVARSQQRSLGDTLNLIICICMYILTTPVRLYVHSSVNLSDATQTIVGSQFLRYFDEGRQTCFLSPSEPKLAVWLTTKLSTDFLLFVKIQQSNLYCTV